MKRVQYLLYAMIMFTIVSISTIAHAETYDQFRALELNCSYDTACELLGKPTFTTGNSCTWSSNGDMVICSFEGGKLYSKQFDTKRIILRVPFTRSQYNSIQQRDSYDTVKAKLNNQDGYLSSQTMFPIFGLQEVYSWRNPDGTVAVIQFLMGMVSNKQIKNEGASSGSASTGTIPPEKAAVKALYDYADAITNKQYEKSYNILSPVLHKHIGSYDNYVKNLGPWDLKIIEHRIINNNETSVTIQAITESKAQFKEGTLVRRFNETMIFEKLPSGWKLAGSTSSTQIDQKLIQ